MFEMKQSQRSFNGSLAVCFISVCPIQLMVMYKKKNTMVFNDYNNIASCRRMVSIETEVRTLIIAKYLFVIYIA